MGAVQWSSPAYPDVVDIRVQWWGDRTNGTTLRLPPSGREASEQRSIKYAVRTSLRAIGNYFRDVGKLVMEVVNPRDAAMLGAVELSLKENPAQSPIDRWLPVLSPDRRALGQMHVLFDVTFFHAPESNLNTSFLAMEAEAAQVGTGPVFPSARFSETASESEVASALVGLYGDADKTLPCAEVLQWASSLPPLLSWLQSRAQAVRSMVLVTNAAPPSCQC